MDNDMLAIKDKDASKYLWKLDKENVLYLCRGK